nr:unnamed protein product [Spirometra erinaceieuropaei]
MSATRVIVLITIFVHQLILKACIFGRNANRKGVLPGSYFYFLPDLLILRLRNTAFLHRLFTCLHKPLAIFHSNKLSTDYSNIVNPASQPRTCTSS